MAPTDAELIRRARKDPDAFGELYLRHRAQLYRWAGTGSYHLSGFGDYRPGANIGHHEAEAFVRQRAGAGALAHGRIQLQPHWKTDYQQLAASYVSSLATPHALAHHEPAHTEG